MWLLFIILQLSYGSHREARWQVFNTQAECKNVQKRLEKGITSEFPQAKTSLTCVKINRVGRPT